MANFLTFYWTKGQLHQAGRGGLPPTDKPPAL
jgi:hypothetical protein